MPKRKSIKKEIAKETKPKPSFELKRITPLTPNQEKTFQAYKDGANLVLHGYAGTGKTYISSYLAINEVLSGIGPYEKVLFIRSVVSSRDIGFLPGVIEEKVKVYEEPFVEIVNNLFGKNNAYAAMKSQGTIDFTTTSFLRGKTFENCIVIVDECQNMTYQELDTVMTRMGENSKIIFCGDFRQTDLLHERDKSGLLKFLNILKHMNWFDYVEFEKEDIVRSGIVKEYIIKKTELA